METSRLEQPPPQRALGSDVSADVRWGNNKIAFDGVCALFKSSVILSINRVQPLALHLTGYIVWLILNL